MFAKKSIYFQQFIRIIKVLFLRHFFWFELIVLKYIKVLERILWVRGFLQKYLIVTNFRNIGRRMNKSLFIHIGNYLSLKNIFPVLISCLYLVRSIQNPLKAGFSNPSYNKVKKDEVLLLIRWKHFVPYLLCKQNQHQMHKITQNRRIPPDPILYIAIFLPCGIHKRFPVNSSLYTAPQRMDGVSLLP